MISSLLQSFKRKSLAMAVHPLPDAPKRFWLALSLCIFILGMGLLICTMGWSEAWGLFGVGTMPLPFGDLHVITAGIESLRIGYDPLFNNPGDIWARPLNYPRAWHCLYFFGVTTEHTVGIGIAISLMFLFTIFLFWNKDGIVGLIFLFAAILSPAFMLGMERANVDLLMFALIGMSILAAQKSSLLSTLLFLIAFVMKLFPIFGAAVLLREEKKKFIPLSATVILFVVSYVLLYAADISQVSRATPRATYCSYGMNVFWMRTAHYYPSFARLAKVFSYFCLFSIGFVSLRAFFVDCPKNLSKNSMHLDAFRAGSMVYFGTFLIGNNWDYRLIFLLFTVPSLLHWIRIDDKCISFVSMLTLSCLYCSMWHVRIESMFGGDAGFLFTTVANWALFAGLVFLFALTMPNWVKSSIRGCMHLMPRQRARL